MIVEGTAYWASIKEERNRVSQELDRINTIEFSLKEARKKVGNIHFANADSKGRAYTDASIDMAFSLFGCL